MIKRKNKTNVLKIRERHIPDYRYLGCPMTKNNSPWCFRICVPSVNGKGKCGRVAPHALRSRIQLSIDDFKRRKKAETLIT